MTMPCCDICRKEYVNSKGQFVGYYLYYDLAGNYKRKVAVCAKCIAHRHGFRKDLTKVV